MEKKRGKRAVLVSFIFLLFMIALINTYYNLYGFAAPNIGKTSISGKAVFNDLLDKTKDLSQKTRIIIAGEWLTVIFFLVYILIKIKNRSEKEKKVEIAIEKKDIKQLPKKSKSDTDIDILYELLKQNKMLTISAISKYFKINKELAMEWCKILEEGNLAEIDYPTIGEPRVIINNPEKVKKEGKN